MAETINCGFCDRELLPSLKNEYRIKCTICDKFFHATCLNISSSTLKYLNEKNCLWTCDSCPKLNDFICNLQKRVTVMEEQIKKLEVDLSKSNGEILELKQKQTKRTYADVTGDQFYTPVGPNNKNRRLIEEHITQNKTPLLVVKSKNSEEVNSVHESVKKLIDAVNDPVKNIRKTKKGNILVQCTDNGAVETIKQRLTDKIGDKVEVNEPKCTVPVLKIVGIHDVDTPEQLKEQLLQQNGDLFKRNCKLEISNMKKIKDYYTALLFVDFDSFKSVLQKGRLRVQWDQCRVYENVNVTRCFKCNSYGHHADKCEQENHTCPRCAGQHDIKSCDVPNGEEKCSNCIEANGSQCMNLNVNHPVWSYNCPVLKRRLEFVKKRIRYTA